MCRLVPRKREGVGELGGASVHVVKHGDVGVLRGMLPGASCSARFAQQE